MLIGPHRLLLRKHLVEILIDVIPTCVILVKVFLHLVQQKLGLTTRKHTMGTSWKHPSAPVFQPVPLNRDQWRLPKAPGV